MMVELWKEIELEYVNSTIHSFTTVTINDRNLEKRGDGRRMIFQCQGRLDLTLFDEYFHFNFLCFFLITADSLYKSQSISDGHLVYVKCKHIDKDIEFVALITSMAYSNKQGKCFAVISYEHSIV